MSDMPENDYWRHVQNEMDPKIDPSVLERRHMFGLEDRINPKEIEGIYHNSLVLEFEEGLASVRIQPEPDTAGADSVLLMILEQQGMPSEVMSLSRGDLFIIDGTHVASNVGHSDDLDVLIKGQQIAYRPVKNKPVTQVPSKDSPEAELFEAKQKLGLMRYAPEAGIYYEIVPSATQQYTSLLTDAFLSQDGTSYKSSDSIFIGRSHS